MRFQLALVASYVERFAGANAVDMYRQQSAYDAFSDAKQELARAGVDNFVEPAMTAGVRGSRTCALQAAQRGPYADGLAALPWPCWQRVAG